MNHVTDPIEAESNNVWSRLRHRKVVQWGIVYVAGAWGLLQGIGFAADAFAWPSAIKQIALLLLLIGLPIVLVLAWYHGDKGEHRLTRSELAVLTLLLLLGGGVLWLYGQRSAPPQSTVAATPQTATATPMNDDHSIAVLPFVDMSQAHDQEYFSDGISEELLNLLAQVPQLRVIARTSSFSFKGKEVDVATIARTLNVANVLEGSVRKSGDTLRITAQLIRASDSSHLWSQTYDRQMTDVFKVQDEIAAAVVAQLKIKLLGGAPKAKTTDPKAYALYLQAREFSRQSSANALDRAVALYQQAVELDPVYAAAWVGLSAAYCQQIGMGLRPANDSIGPAHAAIQKALSIDPYFAPAYAQLGWLNTFYDPDLAAAARHLEHALALEPSNPDILDVAANLARRLGRLNQSIDIMNYVLTLDPVSPDGHADLALAYGYRGRLDEAITEYQTVLKLSPDYLYIHAATAILLLQKGDAKAALAEVLKETDEQLRLSFLPIPYFVLGQTTESDAALGELIRKYGKTSAYDIACVLAYRGEPDRAFDWLDKAVKYHDPSIGAITVDKQLTNLHSDPRWLPLLRRLGMAPEQLAAIKFDVKLPN